MKELETKVEESKDEGRNKIRASQDNISKGTGPPLGSGRSDGAFTFI